VWSNDVIRRWPAPGKLNLFLHITGRRPDGYHTLQTVFQFLDFCDWLEFDPRADGEVHRHGGLEGVAEHDDLTVRAARLLQRVGDTGQGVDISLDKRLPAGGGVGGGSSDAATTLLVLNRLWGLGLSIDRLAGLGLQLGADVPVFVRGHAAWAEGVGEQIQPVDLPEPWFLVVHPGVHVSTAEVFNAPELTRNHAPITIRALLAGGGENDCEPVVRRRYPEIGRALAWLSRFGEARMTGSGACVFCAFDDQETAQAALRQLPDPAWSGFVARGRNDSPLHEMLRTVD
jgi:4-diphosphocytidyl-2-C-methyl-D-erythritol kinase